MTHYDHVTRGPWRLRSKATRPIVQQFDWVYTEETPKPRITDLLWEEAIHERWIASQKASNAEAFPSHRHEMISCKDAAQVNQSQTGILFIILNPHSTENLYIYIHIGKMALSEATVLLLYYFYETTDIFYSSYCRQETINIYGAYFAIIITKCTKGRNYQRTMNKENPVPQSISRYRLAIVENPIVEIRRSDNPLSAKYWLNGYLYIKSGPRSLWRLRGYLN